MVSRGEFCCRRMSTISTQCFYGSVTLWRIQKKACHVSLQHRFKPYYWKTKGTKNSRTLQIKKKKKDKENLIGIVCHVNQLTNKSNSQHAVPQKTQFSGDCRVWDQPALWDPVLKKKIWGEGQTHTHTNNLNNTKRNFVFIINTCPNCPSVQLVKVLPLMLSR